MNFHELNVYNKVYAYVGAILMSVGTYFSAAKNMDNIYVLCLFLFGLLLMLLSFKKPKEKNNNSN